MVANNSISETTKGEHSKSGKSDIITNLNFKSLTGYMTDLIEEDTSQYNYFDRLFSFRISAECPVFIASPLYYWSSGYNRYNGYGAYYPFVKETYRGGIFWPTEKVYLFINSEDPKRWWGVHPAASSWPLSNYDIAAFDPRWDEEEWEDEGWSNSNSPDKF